MRCGVSPPCCVFSPHLNERRAAQALRRKRVDAPSHAGRARAYLRPVRSGGGESVVGNKVKMKAEVYAVYVYRRQERGRFLLLE
jgi:hypothetical protein